jgi:hypothetical protein
MGFLFAIATPPLSVDCLSVCCLPNGLSAKRKSHLSGRYGVLFDFTRAAPAIAGRGGFEAEDCHA